MGRRTLALCVLVGCGPAQAGQLDESVRQTHEAPAPSTVAPRPTAPARPEPVPMPESASTAPEDTPTAPVLTFETPRRVTVRTERRPDAPLRGTIPPGEVISVEALLGVDDRCAAPGWARLGPTAYACLSRAVPTDSEPTPLPALREDGVPFIYARARSRDAPTSRWRSRHAWYRQDEPEQALLSHATYAFVRQIKLKGQRLYENRAGRVVEAKAVRRKEPSEWHGRDLIASPVPVGRTLAWTIEDETHVHARPKTRSRTLKSFPFRTMLELDDADPEDAWLEIAHPKAPDGVGHVRARHIRRWLPLPPRPAAVGPDELWLDVELSQQTLTISRGNTPLFVTLVSSGRTGGGTLRGLFRIRSKLAWGRMRSGPGASRPFLVEGVPWIQYFEGRYALHGAYWHDRFGKRKSHGCINLSPADARHVFELTSPTVPAGWRTIHSVEDEGTVLRVWKRGEELPLEFDEG